MRPLFSFFEKRFGFDLRSLAFFRIILAVLILLDLCVRATSLEAHYTDFGLLPRGPLIDQFSSPWRISIHLISGQLWIEAFLFVVAIAMALMLLVGYRTRLATFLSWFMMISLQARNPMILQAGDVLYRMLLFWGMFLPLGSRYSIDRLQRPPSADESAQKRIFNAAVLAYCLQICFIYWFTAALKLKPNSFPAWWTNATAVYDALNVDQFTQPFGYALLHLPFPILQMLSRLTILFEITGPVLYFIPFYTPCFRTIAALSFIFFHFMLGISLQLGPFSFVASLAAIPFIPSEAWDKLSKTNFFSKKIFPILGTFKAFAGQFVSPKSNNASAASTAPCCKTKKIFVAARKSILPCLFIVYVFFTNLGTLGLQGIPGQIEWLGLLLGLDQRWNMFSPPLKDDGWYVIPGNLKNGKVIDVYKDGGEVGWEKPAYVAYTYKHERWRKYMMNLWMAVNAKHRLYYGKYLCKQWNRRHKGGDQLNDFEIFFMREDTPPYGKKPEVKKVSIWKHYCFELPKPAAPQPAQGQPPLKTVSEKPVAPTAK